MIFQYKPGWQVEVAGFGEGRLIVNVHFDSFDADTGKSLKAFHTFEYVQRDLGWVYCVEKPWAETTLDVYLADALECAYDAVVRFELHELKHWLKDADGNHLVNPHPGEAPDDSQDSEIVQSDEPRLPS